VQNNKHWYKSKTILSGILIILCETYEALYEYAPMYFGFSIPPIPAKLSNIAEYMLGITQVH